MHSLNLSAHVNDSYVYTEVQVPDCQSQHISIVAILYSRHYHIRLEVSFIPWNHRINSKFHVESRRLYDRPE